MAKGVSVEQLHMFQFVGQFWILSSENNGGGFSSFCKVQGYLRQQMKNPLMLPLLRLHWTLQGGGGGLSAYDASLRVGWTWRAGGLASPPLPGPEFPYFELEYLLKDKFLRYTQCPTQTHNAAQGSTSKSTDHTHTHTQ